MDDIIGAQDIIGAELAFGQDPLNQLFAGQRYPMVVGAAEGASLISNPAAAAQTLALRNAAAVVPRQVTKAREYPLGFPVTSIAAGATASVSSQPQVPFRGRRLLIPSDIAGSLLVLDLKVGKNSMFPTSNPVPARGFTEVGVGVDLNLDTAQISQLVTLSVQNISGGAVSFSAMLIGTAVE